MFLASSVSQVKELKKNPRKIVNRTKHLNRDKQKKYARNLTTSNTHVHVVLCIVFRNSLVLWSDT